jgi:hypothetical protein
VGAFVLYRFHAEENAVCVLDVLADETAGNPDEPVNLLEHLLHNLPAVRATSRRLVISTNRNDKRSHSAGNLLSLHPPDRLAFGPVRQA